MAELVTSVISSDNWAKILDFVKEKGTEEIVERFKMATNDLVNIAGEMEKLEVKITESIVKKVTPEVKKEVKQEFEGKIDALHSMVMTLGLEVKKERKARLTKECKDMETTVFVNGIAITQLAINEKRPEFQQETNNMVAEFLRRIRIEANQAGIAEVIRLPCKTLRDKDGKEFLSNTIKIVFRNNEAKKRMYKALAFNGKQVRGIRVN